MKNKTITKKNKDKKNIKKPYSKEVMLLVDLWLL